MSDPEKARQIYLQMDQQVRQDEFFNYLIREGIIGFKSAPTRKSFVINVMDIPVSQEDRTFRDWIDFNRLPDSTGYEKAVIWYDHQREFVKGTSLSFSGRNLRDFLGSPHLRNGTATHHRSQYCHLISWSKLQLMSEAEIEQAIDSWLMCIKHYFGQG